MITFKQFLNEAKAAPLYHATNPSKAFSILKDDNLKAFPTHMAMTPGSRVAVSLTRSLETAAKWRTGETIKNTSNIIFELDQQKLSHNYKIRPIEIEYIWADKGHGGDAKNYVNKQSKLFEEFVDRDIQPLSKYLKAIHMSELLYKPGTLRYMLGQFMLRGTDRDEIANYILNHKLLKVNGKFVNK